MSLKAQRRYAIGVACPVKMTGNNDKKTPSGRFKPAGVHQADPPRGSGTAARRRGKKAAGRGKKGSAAEWWKEGKRRRSEREGGGVGVERPDKEERARVSLEARRHARPRPSGHLTSLGARGRSSGRVENDGRRQKPALGRAADALSLRALRSSGWCHHAATSGI